MKIAEIVSEKFPVPPVEGGAIQTLVYNYSLILNKQFDFTIFSRPTEEQRRDTLNYEPIPYTSLDRLSNKILQSEKFYNKLVRIVAKIYLVYSYAVRCAKKLNSEYDIIHIHNDPNFVPIIKKFNKDSIILLHMHNPHFTSKKYSNMLKKRYKNAIKISNSIICVSLFIKKDIIDSYQEASNKCKVLYNGIDLDRFYKHSSKNNLAILKKYKLDINKITILFVGRFVRMKGLHLLLDSLNNMQNKNFQLLIVGSPQFKNSLAITKYEKLLLQKAKNLTDRLHFLGYVQPNDLQPIFSAADICVAPSLYQEGCPLVVMEAMASENCLIASTRGAIPEIITNEVNGLLFDPNQPEMLTAQLEKAMTDKEMCLRLGRNARKTVEQRFSINTMANRLAQIFQDEFENEFGPFQLNNK